MNRSTAASCLVKVNNLLRHRRINLFEIEYDKMKMEKLFLLLKGSCNRDKNSPRLHNGILFSLIRGQFLLAERIAAIKDNLNFSVSFGVRKKRYFLTAFRHCELSVYSERNLTKPLRYFYY